MPMPFDATLKYLVQSFVRDYEVQMGLTEFAPLVPLNVDLSTVTAATDIALGRGGPPERVVDINFQSGPDPDLEARLLLYNALVHHRFRVPVHTVLVLLRPAAEIGQLTGILRYAGRRRKGKMDFGFEVIRLWQKPVQRLLAGGLGTLPLAPLGPLPGGMEAEEALAPVIRQIAVRLDREAAPEERAKLLTATFALTGLRVPRETAEQLFQGVRAMKESSTHQGILEEGRVEGKTEALQKIVFRLGRQRFGPPTQAQQAALTGIRDVERLERLTDRLLVVPNWQELLQIP
jgi:predicted transposase YdaD